MAGSPVPNRETALVPWLINYSQKLANYAATLGLTPEEVAATQADIDYLVYLINIRVPYERQTLAATLEFKNFMKDGDAAAPLPTTLPGTTPPASYPDPVIPGIVTRLRRQVQNIKSRPGYTETIGEDLDIITGSDSGQAAAPVLKATSTVAGNVSISWNKDGWTGVKLQTRMNGGAWEDLAVDLFSPYVDTRPLSVPGQAEQREYRGSFLSGDTVMPDQSQILVVTVTP